MKYKNIYIGVYYLNTTRCVCIGFITQGVVVIKIKCPYCGNRESKVVDKRETQDLAETRRRRECLSCEKRFTTYEKIENVDLAVIKKDGRREQFNREKLKTGILKACEKRPISHDKINKIVDEIEAKLRQYKKTELSAKIIGELVMKKLKSLDKVAYIRFASVYRDFKDVEDFKNAVKEIR